MVGVGKITSLIWLGATVKFATTYKSELLLDHIKDLLGKQ
jgi:hypothetical protein